MGQLTHDELDALIWGGGRSRRPPTDAALEGLVRRLQVVWVARVVTWLAQTWVVEAWSAESTKATGILMLLYVLSYFLYVRGRQALVIKLLVLLSLVGLVSDIVKPVIQMAAGQNGAASPWTIGGLLALVSISLSLVMLWCNARIVLRSIAPKKHLRKHQ
ncbi:hypothetical protein AaE_011471 [Aphanomyces astaci]|uniref:Uncharacterized protein n=1 Tax=Aphanomyces astaci TaxID=112090 RepID=A0A6A4ZRF3_APHAT|nr:hypothetical protein AaE_011471 [Aphanomyces astaci]